MNREELEKQIIGFFETTYGVTDLNKETAIKDLGGASIKMVAVTSLIENECDVMVPLPTISKAVTINDVIELVAEQL